MAANAILAITKHGAIMGAKIRDALGDADLVVQAKLREHVPDGRAHFFTCSVRQQVEEAFQSYDGLVCIVSLGAVIRLIAPVLKDKRTDPGVVVVDDQGNYAISVLSGHLGGANALARRVAAAIGGIPVITTASDSNETVAVDLLGHEFGWVMEDDRNVTWISAHVVNEEPVAIVQEAGEPGWWPYKKSLPANIHVLPDLETARAPGYKAALVITHRLLGPEWRDVVRKAVVYRPKSLVLGIGCNRGTSAEEIEQVALAALADHGLSFKSVRNVASIDVKADEEGLNAFAAKYSLPVTHFSKGELRTVANLPNPSATVEKYVGTVGVCEPAAILSASGPAGPGRLLVPKIKSGNVTAAIAAIPFAATTSSPEKVRVVASSAGD